MDISRPPERVRAFHRCFGQRNGQVTSLDEDQGLLVDEGIVGAQVRTLYPCTLGVRAVLISEGPGEHEDLLSTPVLVWNEALTSGPVDKGRPFVAHGMKGLDSEVAVARMPRLALSL